MSKISNDNKSIKQKRTVVGNPNDAIPKFCTNINFAADKKSGNITVSMFFQENNDSGYLIERIVIDRHHLKDMRQVIDKILEEKVSESGTN